MFEEYGVSILLYLKEIDLAWWVLLRLIRYDGVSRLKFFVHNRPTEIKLRHGDPLARF